MNYFIYMIHIVMIVLNMKRTTNSLKLSQLMIGTPKKL